MTDATIISIGLAVFSLVLSAGGQVAPGAGGDAQEAHCSATSRSTYLLGPDDELQISGPELDELPGNTNRIDGDGDIQVPLVGRVHVAGLTVQQTEKELNTRLSKYIRQPEVAIDLKELRSQPVSILGAVNNPGVHQVQGDKTLLEMISLAGGIRQDAGYSIRITRQVEWGCIPLPSAKLDSSGQFSVAQVNLKKIMEANNPEENIPILPHDVISIPKAEMIYVIGDVKRSGGFVLGEQESVSVLQALSLAEGLGTAPDTRHAKILRLNSQVDQRVEIAVDVKDILNGKKQDAPLQSEDILFIPDSTGKKAAMRGIEAVIQAGTGMAIWRVP